MTGTSYFWRDPALAFIEARCVSDGRKVCYARHSHEGFSIGAITAGRSTYFDGQRWHEVEQGTLVMMNPGVVHACNPIADQPWSYLMLYLDMPWLRGLGFEPLAQTLSTSADLYRQLTGLYRQLIDVQLDSAHKRAAAEGFFRALGNQVEAGEVLAGQGNERLQRAAQFIREHCTEALKLEQIGAVAGLSTSYLIRAFKQHYGLTPHGYLLDHRVRYARAQLRRGRLIAEVAHEAGFADQAHLQRAFKQHLAATPGHYRSAQ